MHEAYVNITEIPTHIMTWGKWIEESWNNNEKELIICITGNPGLPGFYTKFISTMHDDLGQEIPCWIIGHLGHDDPPSNSVRKVPELRGNENLFDLKAQIKHKLDFIVSYVPKDVKIHLIGHSIGSWMLLELLKYPEVNSRVHQCYLLFPTIERMADSPNGFTLTKLVAPFFFVVRFLYNIFTILPMTIQYMFIYLYFLIFSIPKCFLGTAQKYAKPSVVEKVFFLAMDEMNTVKEADIDVIQNNQNILKFYYGATDGWTPKKYFYQLKEKVPNLNGEIDQKNIEHAFVLKKSVEMGKIVSEWIANNRANI